MAPPRALPLVALAIVVLAPAQSSAGDRSLSIGAPKSHVGVIKAGPAFAKPVRHGFHHPGPSVFPTPVDPWKFWGVKKVHRPFFKPPFFVSGSSGVVVAGTTVVYAPPVVIVAPAPVVYAPPPTPTVIDYPTGRYELRGDGVTSPYQWVWTPKPPPPPPPPADAPPEPAPQSRPPAREERGIGKIYRWTDEDGVTTLTDRLENVPERYRPRAEPKTSG